MKVWSTRTFTSIVKPAGQLLHRFSSGKFECDDFGVMKTALCPDQFDKTTMLPSGCFTRDYRSSFLETYKFILHWFRLVFSVLPFFFLPYYSSAIFISYFSVDGLTPISSFSRDNFPSKQLQAANTLVPLCTTIYNATLSLHARDIT